MVKRSVPRRAGSFLARLNVTRLAKRHERRTLARRLERALALPLRLTVTRTFPRQPRARLTLAGTLIRPRVVKRYGGLRSRRGRTCAVSPGRPRTAFGSCVGAGSEGPEPGGVARGGDAPKSSADARGFT